MKLKKMKQSNCSSFQLLYTALLFGLLILPSVICLRRGGKAEVVIEEADSEESIESDFACPEQFGYYPDQSNCSRYHLCDHGKATVKSCDSGLYFSTILKTCDWPYNVQCADGNRGEFTGRHLRLRANGEEAKSENGVDQSSGDLVPSNRRQPVLSNEDDSYWLGRPESTLLSLGDDDDIVDSYHYEEPQRLSKPKPAQQRNQQPPEHRRSTSPSSSSSSSPTTSPTNEEEEGNSEDDDGRGPWFHSLNFDQIRRQEERKPSVFNRLENSTTAVSTTSGPATTSSPALTNPFIAINNGRGGGWRHTERGSQRQQPQQQHRPTTTEVPHLLPRKALRIGNADEDVLAGGDEQPTSNESGRGGENEPDVNDLRRSQKPRTDSYRLVSHNPTTSRQQQQPTTTPSAELRPLHLGSSRRRNNGSGNRARQPTTLPPPPSTTTSPPATLRPWNVRQPQSSAAVRNTAARTRQPSPDSFRNGIPENAFKQFERRPVLRENFEDDDEDDGGSADDAVGLDDAHYFVNPLEIRKKGRGRGGPARDADPLISGHVAKDVSNTVDGAPRRANRPASNQSANRQTTVPPTTTNAPTTRSRANKQVDPDTIYRSFQAGFRGAVKPVPAGNLRNGGGATNTDDDGNTFRVSNLSVDMEYEEVGNEDEDENVEEADNTEGVAHEDINSTGKPVAGGKEIVVKYDDEEEDSSARNRAASRAGSLNNQRPQFTPFSTFTTVPPPQTTSFRSASPTPPRLTQFVDVFLHNKPKAQSHFTPTPKSNTAIQLVDLVSKKQQKIVNPTGRSFVHFGIVPGLAPNNSSLFFPPSPLLTPPAISPKQPRHVASVGDAAQSVALTPKKVQKVKVVKKIKSSKSDQKQPKRQQQQQNQLRPAGPPPPKTYQYGTYHRAKRCTPEVCQLPDCRCGGVDVPAGLEPRDIPQIVLLTFDDSVNDLNREIYKRLFEQDRKNPNGCPIRATFYVSHEWSDYSQVQNLYSKGHEMASHSISHSFGEKFSKERWMAEIAGQREIMHLYGNVDWRDIKGMRAPFLQTGGNTMFEMLKETNFSYDSSMPVYDINPPFWPYTLDYALGHECMIEPCPTSSIPSLWEVPMIMWEDLRGGRCSMADGCYNPSDEQGVYDMVKLNFNRHYASNKAPFSMFFHSRWFLTEHNMKGFIRFFDEMLAMKDVYVVTNWQMLQWMRRPTPLSQLHRFAPFGCDDLQQRPPLCKAPHTCKVKFRNEMRTLRTCQQCPRRYPWTGNNGLEEDQEAPLGDH